MIGIESDSHFLKPDFNLFLLFISVRDRIPQERTIIRIVQEHNKSPPFREFLEPFGAHPILDTPVHQLIWRVGGIEADIRPPISYWTLITF